jgi:SAM-dependent methyltransferase
MARWIVKALVQRMIGFMPNPDYWSDLVQRRIAGSVDLTYPFFLSRLDVARRNLDAYARENSPAEVLELGTGWFPIVPIALRLSGASHVRTCDIVEHVSPERLSATLQAFSRAAGDGELHRRFPSLDHALMQHIQSFDATRQTCVESLRSLGIDYRVGDFPGARPPPASVDLIVSHAVLEYICEPPFRELLDAFRRVLKSDGVMSHWIDFSDQYAYFDKSISPLNFLKYPDWAWRIINNPIIPLSRLRIDDVRRLFSGAGFSIHEEDCVKLDSDKMRKLPLAREFATRDIEDIRVLDAWISARISTADGSRDQLLDPAFCPPANLR